MKQLHEVLDETEHEDLVMAVIKQLFDMHDIGIKDTLSDEGLGMLSDIASHGADSGWYGFIYYVDTVKFYTDNRKLILALAKEQVESYGEDDSLISFVKSFNCLKDSTEDEVARTLYANPDEFDDNVANGMAWFALEEVARMFEGEE